MRRPLKVIIVDDERLARNKLRAMLSRHGGVEVVGEADSVATAAAAVEQLSPDVVFLDIQMPGETGFDLLNRVSADFKTVFVTAFDEFAIRAFEVNAIDYLLKPVNADRLARSIERLTAAAEPDAPAKPLEYDDHLFLTIDSQSRFLKVSAIECISASGPYTELYLADGKRGLVPRSLKEWEDRLPGKNFARIHRSTIINVEYVERVDKWFNYSYRIFLRAIPHPFIMSRRYAARLKEKLH